MFNSNGGYSLADIAAAAGDGRNNGAWGEGNGAWWIIILFLFVFCGWGNGNNGFFGGRNNGGAIDGYILTSDFGNIERKIDGVNNGLCDGFYAVNSSLLNGFANAQAQISNEFRGVDNKICTLGYQTQQGFNDMNLANITNTNNIVSQLSAMAAQDARCCCETQRQIERGFADTNYNMATQNCETRRTVADSTRDIIDNVNANTRSILDFLTQDKISTLQNENQALRLSASQNAQNNYLVNALRPNPIPAYPVPNPYAYNGCGYQTGCGC